MTDSKAYDDMPTRDEILNRYKGGDFVGPDPI